MLVQLFQAEVLDVLNETRTELGFSPWSPGSCDGVRTLQRRGSQRGKGAPCVKPSVIPYVEEEGKYLPRTYETRLRGKKKKIGFSLVLKDLNDISAFILTLYM